MPRRPKRKSTQPEPAVAPEDVLYNDKDYSGDTIDVAVADLCPNPFNKREMKGVPELAATIETVGLLQDIAHIRADIWLEEYPETADKITASNVILYGEHRWRAVQLLGWETIPSVLRDDKVKVARLITLIENLRRSQLSPLEEAEHYQELRDAGLSYEQIAEKVGETADGAISKGTVWKRVQLLKLAPEVQEALRAGELKVSTAEHLKGMTASDQRDYVALVQGGMRPAEARAQVLARQSQDDEGADSVTDSTVSNGNDTSGDTATQGENTEAGVSTGNDAPGAVPTGKTVPSARKRQKDDGKPTADQYEKDRRTAAAARDVACQLLLKSLDPRADGQSELMLRVLTSAILAPPQQSAAQQRALVWLRRVDRHGLDEQNASTYFNAVQESGDEDLQRLAAFASALAAAELRTAARRQSWGSREVGYIRVLRDFAQYETGTEWEKKELGLVTAGENR